MDREQFIGAVAALALVATVVAANWAIAEYGFMPVGFGLVAPAGVYFAGLAFGLRDVVHDMLGRMAVLVCIAAGGLLSWVISPAFAIASAVAFTVSELADFAVYEPLRRRQRLVAAGLSNIVGAVVDSMLFLWLAFGTLDHLAGQVVGKLWMGALGVVLVALLRPKREPEAA